MKLKISYYEYCKSIAQHLRQGLVSSYRRASSKLSIIEFTISEEEMKEEAR